MTKALEANYINGLLEGELSEYNESGNKISKLIYKGGSKEGLSTLYDQEGRTKKTLYYVNDLLDGPVIDYFPNGKFVIKNFTYGEIRMAKKSPIMKMVLYPPRDIIKRVKRRVISTMEQRGSFSI